MENETQKPEDAIEKKISIWENHARGWLFSGLGYAILICDFLDFVGAITLPVYDGVEKKWQVLGSFVLAAMAFLAPRTFETKLSDVWDGFKNKLFSK